MAPASVALAAALVPLTADWVALEASVVFNIGLTGATDEDPKPLHEHWQKHVPGQRLNPENIYFMSNFLMAQVSELDPSALVVLVIFDALESLDMLLLKRSIFFILSMSPPFDELLLEPEPAIELSDDVELLNSEPSSQLHGHQHTSLQPDAIEEEFEAIDVFEADEFEAIDEFEASDELALMGIVSLELLEDWRSLADFGRLTIDDRNLD